MERSNRFSMCLVLGLLLAAFLVCHGARDIPPKPKPYQPQNVFGFGGFYPGPSISWVFPGTGSGPQVGFGGMPGSGSSPSIGGMPGSGSFPGVGRMPRSRSRGGGVIGGVHGAVEP